MCSDFNDNRLEAKVTLFFSLRRRASAPLRYPLKIILHSDFVDKNTLQTKNGKRISFSSDSLRV